MGERNYIINLIRPQLTLVQLTKMFSTFEDQLLKIFCMNFRFHDT